MSIQRTAGQGPFEASDKRVLAELSERLTETATLSALLGQVLLRSTLEQARRPAVAIDGFGNVLEANAAAEAIFDEDLRLRGRRLVVSDSKARSGLEALFRRLRPPTDGPTSSSGPLVITKRNGPAIVRVVPLRSSAGALFLGASALLLFDDRSTNSEPRLQ
ncbi:MAG TPA: hypothetical protein VK446_10415 [Methylocystis sp.]|nr:hypothetical protein [Methylocystis sp.]